MRGEEILRKINNIDNQLIEEGSHEIKSHNKFYKKWTTIAACLALIVFIIPFASHQDKEGAPFEVCVELNNKIYSIVNTIESPAYDNYNLEKEITSNILGEYLGEYTTSIDREGNKDTFKLYGYINCPVTKYHWMPRIIAQSSDGSYYHGLIGSVFNETEETASEVMEVYGIASADSIVSVENKNGKKITDREFIEAFYKGLFTKEYGGQDFLQENVYENKGIDESKIHQLYSKYADDMVHLKVELSKGLIIGVDFTSHNYVRVDNDLYFKVEDSWLDLVSVLRK